MKTEGSCSTFFLPPSSFFLSERLPVERRTFLSSAFGTTLMAAAGGPAIGQAPGTNQAAAPEFYVWRQFIIRNGTQPRRLADFLQNAAIPALNRLGHKPVGVFEVVAGRSCPDCLRPDAFGFSGQDCCGRTRARARCRIHEVGRFVPRRAGERSRLRAPGSLAACRIPERPAHRDSRRHGDQRAEALRTADVREPQRACASNENADVHRDG